MHEQDALIAQALPATRGAAFDALADDLSVLLGSGWTPAQRPDALLEIARARGLARLAVALVLAELEWDERGGAWVDAVEDRFEGVERAAEFFVDRYGETHAVWSRWIAAVLEDRRG